MSSAGTQFIPVAGVSDLAEGANRAVKLNGWDILICRSGGLFYAILNRCSHRDEPLEGGRVRRGQILCPHHGARFDLATGAVCSLPATLPVAVFEVRVAGDVLEVALPDGPPPAIASPSALF